MVSDNILRLVTTHHDGAGQIQKSKFCNDDFVEQLTMTSSHVLQRCSFLLVNESSTGFCMSHRSLSSVERREF